MNLAVPSVYHTVFEVSFRYLDLLWLILPVLSFSGGLQTFRAHDPKKSRLFQKTFGIFLLAFSILMFWVLLRSEIVAYLEAKRMLRGGRCQIVEGRVEHFVPMPYQGHAVESFDVRGVSFLYSTYEVTPCFNHTSSHGGPIREGLQVRISYGKFANIPENNCVLKLEIAEELSRPADTSQK
jgi:hypothetical protein